MFASISRSMGFTTALELDLSVFVFHSLVGTVQAISKISA